MKQPSQNTGHSFQTLFLSWKSEMRESGPASEITPPPP